MNRTTKLLVICCAVVIVSGCETRSRNAHPKSKQNSSEKKTVLTAEEAASLFANEIGRWKITGKNIPVGGEVELFNDMLETRWRVKGESVEFTVSPLINGKRVPLSRTGNTILRRAFSYGVPRAKDFLRLPAKTITIQQPRPIGGSISTPTALWKPRSACWSVRTKC